MKVKASPINTTAGTIFVLKTADAQNRVLHSAPNKWKTKRGAEKWATENGFNVQPSAKRKTKKTAAPARKTAAATVAKKCPAKKTAAAKSVTRKPTAKTARKTVRR